MSEKGVPNIKRNDNLTKIITKKGCSLVGNWEVNEKYYSAVHKNWSWDDKENKRVKSEVEKNVLEDFYVTRKCDLG